MKNTIVGTKTTIADLFVALDRKCSSVSGICFNDKILNIQFNRNRQYKFALLWGEAQLCLSYVKSLSAGINEEK